jgi:hypothetical protein
MISGLDDRTLLYEGRRWIMGSSRGKMQRMEGRREGKISVIA